MEFGEYQKLKSEITLLTQNSFAYDLLILKGIYRSESNRIVHRNGYQILTKYKCLCYGIGVSLTRYCYSDSCFKVPVFSLISKLYFIENTGMPLEDSSVVRPGIKSCSRCIVSKASDQFVVALKHLQGFVWIGWVQVINVSIQIDSQ